jgi:hypothetical protein
MRKKRSTPELCPGLEQEVATALSKRLDPSDLPALRDCFQMIARIRFWLDLLCYHIEIV